MVGGVVADIFKTEDRNTPMALFSGLAFFGTGLGPLVSGFIAQHLNWRWIFWVQVISCGLIMLAVVIFFKETRGSVLLSRKAARLNEWYEAREKVGLIGFNMPVGDDYSKTESQRVRWKVKSDEERETLTKMIGISLYRPFREFLFYSPFYEMISLFLMLVRFYSWYYSLQANSSGNGRSPIDRTRGILLFLVGVFQLGCPILNL